MSDSDINAHASSNTSDAEMEMYRQLDKDLRENHHVPENGFDDEENDNVNCQNGSARCPSDSELYAVALLPSL